MPPASHFTIGWICALQEEYTAAQCFLDESYGKPEEKPANDDNDYTLGRIKRHHIVIAVLPKGRFGSNSAATVARDMLRSFPDLRLCLMVGIGGAAPSQGNDIRLGDVVVSTPNDDHGGVIHYDFGKAIQDQVFKRIGSLNGPPNSVQAAVNSVSASHNFQGSQTYNKQIEEVTVKLKRAIRKSFRRPDLGTDLLYKQDIVHPDNSSNSPCDIVCGTDDSKLIPRTSREEDEEEPEVHYGVIASGSKLMKDAIIRDQIMQEHGIICFEMEAAGLMNQFPCLVIRGVSDYADSHKNDLWKGYAAMAAAAYAKDLLNCMTPISIQSEMRLRDVFPELLQSLEDTHRSVLKGFQDIQRDQARRELTKNEKECHQLFRLVNNDNGASYEWYKERIEDQVENTCRWVLEHDDFTTWLRRSRGSLLISADPGCGKSVLSKYLIDHFLPAQTSATICYFFFDYQDQDTTRQALCAILHQIFLQKPQLLKHAMKHWEADGEKLISSSIPLWSILQATTADPDAGPIIIVIDAVDECGGSDVPELAKNLNNQSSSATDKSNLRYLLTTRPYEQIVSKFRQHIRIPGEEESEAISQEVNHVIAHRVERLSRDRELSPTLSDLIKKKLLKVHNRTYLWVYLVFDRLEKEDFKKTIKTLDTIIKQLPESIYGAYNQMLDRTKNDHAVRTTLCIILAAARPLTVSELNVATSIDDGSETTSLHKIDPEEDYDFKLRIRSLCGLFISIYNGRVHLIHQTAREFLLSKVSPQGNPVQPQLKWHGSITIHQAHKTLAELCVQFLYLLGLVDEGTMLSDFENIQLTRCKVLLAYASLYWTFHFKTAETVEKMKNLQQALNICDPSSSARALWLKSSPVYDDEDDNLVFGGALKIGVLEVVSCCGLVSLVQLCLSQSPNVNTDDNDYEQAPLSWAAAHGHYEVAHLLLQNQAQIDAQDWFKYTALLHAALNGHYNVVRLLLQHHAQVDIGTWANLTALSEAASNGHYKVVELLLEHGADIEATTRDGDTALTLALENHHGDIAELLQGKHHELQRQRDEDFEEQWQAFWKTVTEIE